MPFIIRFAFMKTIIEKKHKKKVQHRHKQCRPFPDARRTTEKNPAFYLFIEKAGPDEND